MRVTREDPAEQRRGEAVRRFPSQSARDEIADGFVVVAFVFATRHERLERHARLRAQREEARPHHGRDARRHAEHDAFRHRMKARIPCNIHASVCRDRRDELFFETAFARERGRFGLGHDPTVGTCVHHEAGLALGAHVAADARAAFDDDHVRAIAERARAREPGHPRADDDDFHASNRRAMPASTAMKSSASFSDSVRDSARPRASASVFASMSMS